MASKSLSCADARPAQLHSIYSQRHARLQMLCLRPRHRTYLTHSLKELDSVREDEKLPWSISGKINGWNTRMSCIRVY